MLTAADFIRAQLKRLHAGLDKSMAELTPDQLHRVPVEHAEVHKPVVFRSGPAPERQRDLFHQDSPYAAVRSASMPRGRYMRMPPPPFLLIIRRGLLDGPGGPG